MLCTLISYNKAVSYIATCIAISQMDMCKSLHKHMHNNAAVVMRTLKMLFIYSIQNTEAACNESV